MLEQLRGFIKGPVPPNPGGEFLRQQGVKDCETLLQDGISVDTVLQMVHDYQQNPAMQPYYDFASWPKANSAEQVEQTVGTSQDIVNLHKDRKTLVSDVLSQHVVAATGRLIFGATSTPEAPVLWLDHDIVARQLIEMHGA